MIRVRSTEDIGKLTIGRLAPVREVDITQAGNSVDWQQFFQAADELSELKIIHGLMFKDLRAVEANLLVRVLTRLEDVIVKV